MIPEGEIRLISLLIMPTTHGHPYYTVTMSANLSQRCLVIEDQAY